MTLKGKVTWPF